MSPVRVLAITKIFPNAVEPLSSPFNRQQFAALGRLCELDVLASIPWFPGAAALGRWSNAGRLTSVPRRERIDELDVVHPRTLYVPRVGHSVSGLLYAGSLLPEVMRRRGTVDVVLGSWAYPDGCAAVALARLLDVPAVVKLHGSDLNVVAKMPGPRAFLRRYLPRASRVVAVSRALGREAVALGVEPERVRLVYNGVDAALFHVRDRASARRELGLPVDGKQILYVGHLKETKGVVDLAHAFRAAADRAPDAHLVIVGDGAARPELEAVAATLPGRVHLCGAQPLERVPAYMAACDFLCLPSWNEGTPNVLLEAVACGRRLVASNVGGIPDIITSPAIGEMVPPRDRTALADALLRNLAIPYDPAALARSEARGDWDASAAALAGVLREAIAEATR